MFSDSMTFDSTVVYSQRCRHEILSFSSLTVDFIAAIFPRGFRLQRAFEPPTANPSILISILQFSEQRFALVLRAAAFQIHSAVFESNITTCKD